MTVKTKRYAAAMAALAVLAALFALFQGGAAKKNIVYNENILQNSGFEETDAAGRLVKWTTDAYDRTTAVTQYERDEGKEGRAAVIENRGANDARYLQTVKVEPDTVYCLEGDIKADCREGRGANLSIADVYVFSESVYTEDSWRHVKLYGVTGAKQHEVTVYARLGGYSGESVGKAWFDNVRLSAVEKVPDNEVASAWYRRESEPDRSEEGESVKPAWPYLLLIALCYIPFALYLARRAETDLVKDARGMNLGLPALLAAAFFMRLAVALTVPGYGVDIGCFTAWANRMAEVGPGLFYHTQQHSDYPPAYMLMLWPLGLLGRALQTWTAEWMVKLPPVLCDVAAAGLLYHMARAAGARERAALALAAIYAFNPVTILTGAAWGQADSVMTLFLVLAVVFAVRGQWRFALPVYVFSVLLKPQALMFGPLGLAALVGDLIADRKKKKALLDAGVGLALSLAVSLAVVLPFQVNEKDAGWLVKLYAGTMTYYDRATVNACNLYFLFSRNWTPVRDKAPLLLRLFGMACVTAPVVLYGVKSRLKNKKHWAMLAVSLLPALAAAVVPGNYALFGALLMASLLLIVIFRYAIAGNKRLLFLLGAVLLTGFSAFGTMMHERYLFPALLLLMGAYILQRDKRVLLLMALVSAALFLNIGLVLDRAVRIGGVEGHLHAPSFGIVSDSAWLEYALSGLHTLGAAFALYLGCIFTDKETKIVKAKPFAAVSDAGGKTEKQGGDKAATWKEIFLSPRRLSRPGRRETALVWAVTALYALFALVNLGSLKAPQKPWVASAIGETAVLDMGSARVFKILYYPGIHWGDSSFTIQTADSVEGLDAAPSYTVTAEDGHCFSWRYHKEAHAAPIHRGRYLRLTAQNIGLTLMEILARDIDTDENIGMTPLDERAERLADEQDTMEREPLWFPSTKKTQANAEPGWFNSMYFDEIYHARTAYEQLNALRGLEPSAIYETTHPPLGKVLMTLSVAIFGMTPFGWRFAGAMAGALMLPGVFFLARLVTGKKRYAWLALSLFMFDCLHFTQTRIATIDSFGTVFIVWSFYFMLSWVMRDKHALPFRRTLPELFFAGLMMGFAIASKWTGCYAGVGLSILFFIGLYRNTREGMEAEKTPPAMRDERARRAAEWKKRALQWVLWAVLFFVVIPAVIYYLSYYPAFASDYDGLTLKKVVRMNEHMLSYHAVPGRGMDHPYYSPWYLWPISQKPMYYASAPRLGSTGSTIFAFGNPAVWWTGLAAVLATLWLAAKQHVGLRPPRLKRGPKADLRALYIFIAFAVQYFPWALVPRGTYIYHYFPSVPFIILSTVFVLSEGEKKFGRPARVASYVLWALAGILFIGFYPYVSGLRVPAGWLEMMNLIPGLYY